MNKVNRASDLISSEKRKAATQEIIIFFKKERNQEIGIIAAEQILDLFLNDVGLDIYNKGVKDTANLVKVRFEDLELDMDALLKNK